MQIVDCHTHILSAGSTQDGRRFYQDLCCGNFRARGLLPSDHVPTEEEWDTCKWLFDPISPEASIADHEKALEVAPAGWPGRAATQARLKKLRGE